MNKLNLTLTSLVAAIPAAVLMILLVMGFINYAGGPTGVKVISGITLLLSAGLALMPVGIFVLSGPKAEKPPKAKNDEKKSADKSEEAVAAAVADEPVADDAGEFEVGEEELLADSEDFAETVVQPASDAGSDDFDMGSDFDLDDEPAPKKGK